MLAQPVQARQTGFLDVVLNNPLSRQYQQLVQQGYKSRRYALSYAQKDCGVDDVDVDVCGQISGGYTPSMRNIEYSFEDAPVINTGLIKIGSRNYQEWCELNGGGTGYLQMLQSNLVTQIQRAYERLEKKLLQELVDNAGCYADGTPKTTPRTLNLFLNPTSGVPTVNPAWSFPVEQDLAMIGLESNPYFIGGAQFWQARRVLEAQYSVPNTMLGVNPAQAKVDGMAFSPMMSQVTTGNNFEKVLVVSPEACAITTFSNVLNEFGNTALDYSNLLTTNLFTRAFDSTSRSQAHAFVIVDPIKGQTWDVFASLEQCGANFDLYFVAQLTYRFHVLPMQERICDNNCYTGIQIYQLCPQPTPEACDEPPAPVVPTRLCIDVALPEDCNLAVQKGAVITFTVGGFSISWTSTLDFVITNTLQAYALLANIFGANAGKGGVFVNANGDIEYDGNGNLAIGVGTLSDGDGCFDAIVVTVAACA